MYGPVARLRLKPGREQAFFQQFTEIKALNVPGYAGDYVYRMDTDPNEYYLAVLFENKETYQANALDPAQDKRY